MNITVYENFTIKCLNQPMTVYIAADNYYTATMLNITGSGNNWGASEVYVVPTTDIACGTIITLTMKAYNSPSPGRINCQSNPGALIYAVTTNDCPCTVANTLYNSKTCKCDTCRSLMHGCTACSSSTVCTTCDSASNFQLSSGACVCPSGYAYVSASDTCITVCGDGLVRNSQLCDDGNLYVGDGCDSFCAVEQNYTCTNTLSTPSNCSYNKPIQAEIVSITKTSQHNSFTLKANISSNFPGLSSLNFTKLLTTNIPLVITNATLLPNGQLQITCEYSQDVEGKLLLLTFNPVSSNGSYWGVPSSAASCINLTSSGNLPLLYIDNNQLNQQRNIISLVTTAEIVSYGVLLIGLICDKVIGIELFGVWQTVLFSLSTISKVPPIIIPLLDLRTVNGINSFMTGTTDQLPESIGSIAYFSEFLANCSYTVWLIGLDIIVGILLLIIARCRHSYHSLPSLIAKRMLMEYFVMLVAFNSLNICYSSGLQLIYGSSTNISSMVSMTLCLAMVLGAIVLLKCSKQVQHFGEFRTHFKTKDCFSAGFVSTTILYRCLLGFSMSVLNSMEEATIFNFMVGIVFTVYLIADTPFRVGRQNWRSCAIQLCNLTALFVAMYYRSMKSTTPIAIRTKIDWPCYLVLAALCFSTILSVIAVLYELSQKIRAKCASNKVIPACETTAMCLTKPTEPATVDTDLMNPIKTTTHRSVEALKVATFRHDQLE